MATLLQGAPVRLLLLHPLLIDLHDRPDLELAHARLAALLALGGVRRQRGLGGERPLAELLVAAGGDLEVVAGGRGDEGPVARATRLDDGDRVDVGDHVEHVVVVVVNVAVLMLGGEVGEGRVAALQAALQTRHLLFRRPRLFSG